MKKNSTKKQDSCVSSSLRKFAPVGNEKKSSTKKQEDYELREEYDLTKMTIVPKGRFDPKHRIGKNVVVLAPDVAKAFPNDEAVNEALRLLIKASQLSKPTSV